MSFSDMSTGRPKVVWAQRRDRILMTVEITGATDVKINLKPEGGVSFSCKSNHEDSRRYTFDMQLSGEINVAGSTWAVRPRCVEMILMRKEEGEYWDHLVKGADSWVKTWVKTDWAKWVDEDDDDDKDLSGFGTGGQEGHGDEDDDDDIEEAEIQAPAVTNRPGAIGGKAPVPSASTSAVVRAVRPPPRLSGADDDDEHDTETCEGCIRCAHDDDNCDGCSFCVDDYGVDDDDGDDYGVDDDDGDDGDGHDDDDGGGGGGGGDDSDDDGSDDELPRDDHYLKRRVAREVCLCLPSRPDSVGQICTLCEHPFTNNRVRVGLPCSTQHNCSSSVCRDCVMTRVKTLHSGADFHSCPYCRRSFLPEAAKLGEKVTLYMPVKRDAADREGKGSPPPPEPTQPEKGGGREPAAPDPLGPLKMMMHGKIGTVVEVTPPPSDQPPSNSTCRVRLDECITIGDGLCLWYIDARADEYLVSWAPMEPLTSEVAQPPAPAGKGAAERGKVPSNAGDAASAACQESQALLEAAADAAAAPSNPISASSAGGTMRRDYRDGTQLPYFLSKAAKVLLEQEMVSSAIAVAGVALEIAGGDDSSVMERGVSLARMVAVRAALNAAEQLEEGARQAQEANPPDPGLAVDRCEHGQERCAVARRHLQMQILEEESIQRLAGTQVNCSALLTNVVARIARLQASFDARLVWAQGAAVESAANVEAMDEIDAAVAQVERAQRVLREAEQAAEERGRRIAEEEARRERTVAVHIERGQWQEVRDKGHRVLKRVVVHIGEDGTYEVRPQTFTMSSTSSDHRADANILADLRRLDDGVVEVLRQHDVSENRPLYALIEATAADEKKADRAMKEAEAEKKRLQALRQTLLDSVNERHAQPAPPPSGQVGGLRMNKSSKKTK